MLYEQIKFSNNHIVTYIDYSTLPKKEKNRSINSDANLIQLTKKSYNGYMSKSTAKKCKEYINVLINALYFGSRGKRKPTFVTLTLSAKQKHTDNELKRGALDAFLIYAKRNWNVKNQFWRAEPQENGNLHFHILFDTFVDWRLILGHWNKIQHKLGYIGDYRNNMNAFHSNGFSVRTDLLEKWSYESQKKAYEYGIKTNWSNPNSTDIHALKSVKNVAGYICKYMTKGTDAHLELKLLNEALEDATDEKIINEIQSEINRVGAAYRIVKGRIWGTTKALKKYKYFTDVIARHDFDRVGYNYETIDYYNELKKDSKNIVKESEHFNLIVHRKSQSELLRKHAPSLYKKYKSYYQNIYKELYK